MTVSIDLTVKNGKEDRSVFHKDFSNEVGTKIYNDFLRKFENNKVKDLSREYLTKNKILYFNRIPIKQSKGVVAPSPQSINLYEYTKELEEEMKSFLTKFK